jgi:hypothetical protein
MVPLSLFTTVRRHWTWLRVASELLCQFSGEARLHQVKKNEGSCTPSLGCLLSPLASHSDGCVCVRGGVRHPSPFPTGTSNLQPVLNHAIIVFAQNWLTGELLFVCVTDILTEEPEPLWLAALLLRVPEAFGRYISLHSARSACY